MGKTYFAIDLKSFYASVECIERGLDPMTTNLVVADKSRTEKTICLAVSPSLKAYGVSGRARLFEVIQRVEHAHGTQNLERYTSSSKMLMDAATALYERVVKQELLVRRMYLTATHVIDEGEAPQPGALEQMDLFTDYRALEQQRKEENQELSREHQRQKAVLEIKKKFGKNAILKGISFTEGATGRERNGQVGGHKA